MTMTQITLKDGKKIKGFWNGKIYNGIIYINRPVNGNIEIIDEQGTFGSPRKSLSYNISDIVDGLNNSLPKTTESWMKGMYEIETKNN